MRAVLLLLLAPALAAALDLAHYTIEERAVAVPEQMIVRRPHMKAWTMAEHVLRFDGVGGEVTLGRSAVEPLPGGATNRLGFDRDTLKLAWLDPERLLWVRWQTVPQGQGTYSKEGHVVVLRDGDGFRELFRDSIYAYGSAGALDAASETLEIEYDSATATLAIVSTLGQTWSSARKRPLDEYRGTSDGGQRLYAGESTTRTVWRYRLAGAELRFTSGERWVEYPATTYPRGVKLKAVARAFATSVDRLVRLNPRLAGTDRFDGRIRVDDAVGPYQPQNDDGLTD